jgi:hypothetical protein
VSRRGPFPFDLCQGGVLIPEVEPLTEGDVRLHFRVIDTGIGIPPTNAKGDDADTRRACLAHANGAGPMHFCPRQPPETRGLPSQATADAQVGGCCRARIPERYASRESISRGLAK